MPLLGVEDMCDALIGAYDRFTANNNGDFAIQAEKGVLRITHVNRNNRHDYGPHFSYYCTNQGAQKVVQRWNEISDTLGRSLPLQFKHALQVNQINLIIVGEYGVTLFNFHITLMTQEEDAQLKALLDLEALKYQAELQQYHYG